MAETEIKSIFDIPPHEALEAAADAVAEAEIDAGKGVPHERVREWLLKLAKGERVPPPGPAGAQNRYP
jgi:predicted transcriptional regulator